MKREEAIAVYNGLISTKIKEAFEFFAPELREINDEEIRKDIIGGLMWQRDNLKSEGPHDNNLILPGFCLTVGKHLSYLEKQKDLDKMIVVSPEVWDKAINDAYENGKKEGEKQKEQKPWKVGANAYFTPEQKPAEWSEEDEWKIVELKTFLAKCKGFNRSNRQKAFEMIDSLRPSWRPSEQEKGALRTAIRVLTEERNFPKAASHLQAILDAFDGKESRKDWKPSEELISSLKQARDYYMSGRIKYVGRHLSEIAEQLEKLM